MRGVVSNRRFRAKALSNEELVAMLEQLNDQLLGELSKTKLRDPAARCPAAHNRALFDPNSD